MDVELKMEMQMYSRVHARCCQDFWRSRRSSKNGSDLTRSVNELRSQYWRLVSKLQLPTERLCMVEISGSETDLFIQTWPLI